MSLLGSAFHLAEEIQDLREKQAGGRAGTKAASEREVQIESKQRRLQNLDTIKHFTYNPNGEKHRQELA